MVYYLNSLQHEVTEVRILRSEQYIKSEWCGYTISGYYTPDAYDQIEKHIKRFDGDSGTNGIYTTLQCANPALHARAANRLQLGAKTTTSDEWITHFTAFPIDVDAENPSGTSASNTELQVAKSKATEIYELLKSLGIPYVSAMSGNGYHALIYVTPLECNEKNSYRWKASGDLVAEQFGSDTKNYNPSRIWKLYGTFASKGDSTDKRPYRRAEIHLPETITRIDFAELEEKLNAELSVKNTQTFPPISEPTSKIPSSRQPQAPTKTLREWLDEHDIAYNEKPYKGTSKYQVDCPHDPSHKRPDAWVTDEGGAWQFSCSHNSCKGERSTWAAFKKALGIENQHSKHTKNVRDSKSAASSVTIKEVKAKVKEFVVDEADLSETEKSDARREIFDWVSELSPIDREAIIPTLVKSLEVSINAIRGEIRNRKSKAFEAKDCKNWTADGKRIIWVTDAEGQAKQQGRLTDEVFEAVCAENKAEPFIFDNDGWVTVRDGTERMKPVSSDELRSLLADRFDWWRVVRTEKHGFQQKPVPEVPAAIAKGFETHKTRHVRIPKLEAVINRPVLLPSGEFRTQHGYIPELNSYLLSDYDFKPMSSIDEAREALLTPFQHFPFKSDRDRAVAFAYLFTLLLRDQLGDHVPFFHFGAARQGTGKGLLVNSFYQIAEGSDIPHSTYHRDEQSLLRSVASSLLAGSPGILFDNLADGLIVSSPYLELIATAPVVSVRVLYETQESRIRMRSVIAFTGNNLSFDGGLRRRVQNCRLEVDVEHPEDRALPNLPNYLRSERMKLLSAALTIVDAWQKDGCVEKSIAYGSFEKWAGVIAGVLEVAGINDFNPTTRQLSDRDTARRVFIQAVWETYGTDEWGVKETLHLASPGTDEQPGENILAEFLTGDRRNYPHRLGYVLRGFAGQVFDFDNVPIRVERIDGVSPVKYKLVSLSDDDGVGF